MRYKNNKQYQICHHHIRFLKLKMHQNLFSAGTPPRTPLGSLRRSPKRPSRLGSGMPPPHSPRRIRRLKLGAYTTPRFSGPLNTKSWLRQCVQGTVKRLLRALCCTRVSIAAVCTRLNVDLHFYRTMHFSAKRGLAIACRPSVSLRL